MKPITLKQITQMSTTTRLNKFQRCKYLDPNRWLDGSLVFWNDQMHTASNYEPTLQAWIASHTNIKENSITQKK
jgi:hypothetical protein